MIKSNVENAEIRLTSCVILLIRASAMSMISGQSNFAIRRQANIRSRTGFSLIYVLIVWVALLGFVSLAVDWGRVQLVKTQLQKAADASARAAVSQVSVSVSAAQNAAVAYGSNNLVDGTPLVIDPNNDIDFGTWNTGSHTFTVLSGAARSGANAIRITASRTSAKGNAIVRWFKPLAGQDTVDINVKSIACITAGASPNSGLQGLSSVSTWAGAFVASYDSNVLTNPTHGTSSSQGLLGSNGTISGLGSTLNGSLIRGPSSTNSGFTISGTNTQLLAVLRDNMPYRNKASG